jgi:hypothetical protein
MRISTATRWAEGFGAGAAIALLGLLNKADPSFARSGFLPQVLASVLAAALLGSGPGILALAGAALGTAVLPSIGALLGLGLPFPGSSALFAASRVPAAAALGCALAAGYLRDAYARGSARVMGRLRDLVRRNVQLKKMNRALALLSDELERRVSGQRDSVSALYARIRKMDSSDLDKVLSGLLEAIAAFSQASSALVYEYEPRTERLVLLAHIGPEGEAELALDGSLEGWVFRNDTVFSLRSVDDYLNISRVDYRDSVLAFPLKAGGLPWGVLNVREMPFYRYNPITENNLGIVVELASAYIRKAVDFRDRVLRHPRNEITGLPGYGELRRVLGEELERRADKGLSVSVVVVEILGFAELAFSRSGQDAFLLLKAFAEAATTGGRALAFHSREDGQLAFVLPDTDRGGASLYCLGLSETASAGKWKAGGQAARIEIAFGLSSFPGSTAAGQAEAAARPEVLIAEAESVLELSKVAFVDHGGGGR